MALNGGGGRTPGAPPPPPPQIRAWSNFPDLHLCGDPQDCISCRPEFLGSISIIKAVWQIKLALGGTTKWLDGKQAVNLTGITTKWLYGKQAVNLTGITTKWLYGKQAVNLTGISVNPRFEGRISEFMVGIPDFFEKFNTF